MGPRYQAIASFLSRGPAWLNISIGNKTQAGFVVSSVSLPEPAHPYAPFSGFTIQGPAGMAYIEEEEIAHIQPDGPQEGTNLYVSLDNGVKLTLTRTVPPG